MSKRLFFSVLLTATALISVKADNEQVTDSLRRYKMDEVTVYASKTNARMKDLPNKVEVINKRQIESSGVSNITDLLKNTSSIDVVQYPGYNSYFSIRGFKPTENKYTLVLIDGVPAGTSNMATLALGDVEQVEMMKGPFSALYGSDAMAGVVNIVTKKNKGALTGGIKTSLGSFQSGRGGFNIGGRVWKGLSFDASADYAIQGQNYKIGNHNFLHMSQVDEAIIGKDTYGKRMPGSRSNGFSGRFRLGYDINENWSLDFTQSGFMGKDLPVGGNFWSTYGIKKKDVTRQTSKLELQGEINNHNLFFAPYFSKSRTETYNNDTDEAYVATDSELRTVGFTLNDNLILGKQRISFGIDNRNDINKLTTFKNNNEIKAPYKPNYNNSSLGVYVQSNLQFFDERLNLSVGGRYDHIFFKLKKTPGLENAGKTETYNTINPNVGVKYFFTKAINFHTSFGTAFSMPDAYQKAGEYLYNGTITLGNPNLKPEKSRTLDLGVGLSKPEIGVDLDVTYFYTWNDNLIVDELSVDDEGQKYKTYNNADKAVKSGLEVMGSYNFGTLADYKFSLKLYGNLTWMFNFKNKTSEGWIETISVRKQNANFGLDFLSQCGFSARLNGRFIGHRFEKDFIGDKVRPTLNGLREKYQAKYYAKGLVEHPEFLVWDFSASYPIKEKITIGLNINNILDENYTEKDGFNMPGRNFALKASYNF